jgi:hypothetical protein
MASLHFVFHAGHLDGFSTADAIAELVSLGAILVVPAVAVWGVGARRLAAAAAGGAAPR